MTTTKKLKWLIAHRPAYLFVRTAEAFANELEKRCPGEFEIEILTIKDYIEKYGDIPEMRYTPKAVNGLEEGSGTNTDVFIPSEWSEVKMKWKAVFQGMKDDKFQLSQTQVTTIGGNLYPLFGVLDLPFLFNSHDHLANVLDGKIGDALLESMGEKTDIKGLGFTYSGGYRIVGSNHPINNLSELKDVEITTVPLTQDFFGQFASKAESRVNQKIEEIESSVNSGGAVETTYLRFTGKNILKTNHSMFLTSILVGGEFFNTLTETQQQAFKEAAKIVAKLERKWSIEDAEKYEAEAVSKGIQIIEITDDERQLMRNAAPQQYTHAYDVIVGSYELVDNIKNTK